MNRLLALACLVAACSDPQTPEVRIGSTNGPPQPLAPLEPIPWQSLGTHGRLAFERISMNESGSGIYVLDVTTQSSWGFRAGTHFGPAISPDGQLIAYGAGSLHDVSRPNDGIDIFASDVQGENERRMSRTAELDFAPSWSADGATLYFLVSGEMWPSLYSRPTSGTHLDQNIVPLPYGVCTSIEGPVSASASGHLVFAVTACENASGPMSSSGIYVTGSSMQDVTWLIGQNPAAGRFGVRLRAPAWSPDGTRVAFLEVPWDTLAQAPLATRVRVMDHAGGSLRTIAELTRGAAPFGSSYGGATSEHALAWSPDGTLIAFNHYADGRNADIYIVGADGSGLTRITTGAGVDRNISWSH